MGVKSDEMKELMGRIGNVDPKPKPSLQRRRVERNHDELPIEVMVNAKQDRIHEEFPSKRKIKRIRLKKDV